MKNYLQSGKALGGDVQLNICTSLKLDLVENLFAVIWRIIADFESKFSRFIPDSELSLFNKNAGTK